MTAAATNNAIALAAQLARHWSASTGVAGGLSYLDPDTGALADGSHAIFTAQAPISRADPTASIIVESGAGADGYDGFITVGLLVSAFASSIDAAMSLLEDLRSVVRPSNRPLVFTGAAHGGAFDLGGVIGAPTLAVGDPDRGVFRVRNIQILAGPQPVRAHLAAGGADPDNLAQAVMRLVVSATADAMPAPLRAFNVSVGPAGGAVSATADADAARLRITWDDGVLPPINSDFTFAASPTIGQLRAAVAASGEGDYTVGAVDATLDARATATDLIDFTATDALGPGAAADITVRP